MRDLRGHCLCGAVKWKSEARPLWQAHCHCDSCRRATGAPFTSFVGMSRAAVHWNGERAFFESSPGVRRGFCPRCGTPLSYESTRWPDEVHLYAATLDDPERYRPTAHVNAGERLSWIELADGLPTYLHTANSDQGT